MAATARLGIEVVIDPNDPDWPSVEFLIDGRPMLAGTRWSDWLGFDPGEILARDAPLVPAAPWQRVAVYRCGCGIAGDGVVAPLIVRRSDGTMLWTDFRDYTGVFDGPTVDDDPDGGHRLRLPEVTFDRAQYEDEVRRATADRRWETSRRATARLIQYRLDQDLDRLNELGLRLQAVWPERDRDAMTISLTRSDQQEVFTISSGDGPPETRAEQVVTALWSTPSASGIPVISGSKSGPMNS